MLSLFCRRQAFDQVIHITSSSSCVPFNLCLTISGRPPVDKQIEKCDYPHNRCPASHSLLVSFPKAKDDLLASVVEAIHAPLISARDMLEIQLHTEVTFPCQSSRSAIDNWHFFIHSCFSLSCLISASTKFCKVDSKLDAWSS